MLTHNQRVALAHRILLLFVDDGRPRPTHLEVMQRAGATGLDQRIVLEGLVRAGYCIIEPDGKGLTITDHGAAFVRNLYAANIPGALA